VKTKFIEASSSFNWGKFMVGRFEPDELKRRSHVSGKYADKVDDPVYSARMKSIPLLNQIGFDSDGIFVFDLQTCEGAVFYPHRRGPAKFDLEKHQIWCCPMFLPFLEWLYQQDCSDLDALPAMIEIPPEVARKHEALSGYRRAGPDAKERKRILKRP
jgi:hypothetical protein